MASEADSGGPGRRCRPTVPIVFTHVPKAGGSTLVRRVLAPAVGRERLERVDSVRRLATSLRRGDADIVGGHVPWGVHLLALRRVDYLITLRDPWERSLSHFEFDLSHGHGADTDGGAAPDPIAYHRRPAHRNLQTKFAAGWMPQRTDLDIPRGLERTVLAAARRNLARSYTWVGFVETMETSLTRLAAHYGWTAEPAAAVNANPGRRRLSEIPAAEAAAIAEANTLDRLLYDWAVERLGP